MDNLDELLNPASNALWNLVLAVVVIAVSFWIARVVRRRIRAVLEKYDLDESASALLSRSAGWGVVLLGLILALSIMGYSPKLANVLEESELSKGARVSFKLKILPFDE